MIEALQFGREARAQLVYDRREVETATSQVALQPWALRKSSEDAGPGSYRLKP
jgi:hypothetical protein